MPEPIIKTSNKIKFVIIILIGTIIAGAAIIYQKLFGGKIKALPNKSLVINQSTKQMNTNKKENNEILAVAYADTPEKGVREVIARTGNLDFIKQGQKVLIKPNVNSDDPAPGTTHPKALAEVVRLVKNKGAYVIVGDRSNSQWDTISAMKKTGMYQAALDAGADEIIGFENEEWVRVKPENVENWPKGFRIPKLVTEVDHIISVPVLHTHMITSHSLALKNLVGLIHPIDRMIFHASPRLEEMIAEISLGIKPSLTIIEGTKAFIDGGPSSGTVANTKVYLASKDTLTADVAGIELLRKHRAKLSWDTPWESGQVRRALELNLSLYKKNEIQKEIEKIN